MEVNYDENMIISNLLNDIITKIEYNIDCEYELDTYYYNSDYLNDDYSFHCDKKLFNYYI